MCNSCPATGGGNEADGGKTDAAATRQRPIHICHSILTYPPAGREEEGGTLTEAATSWSSLCRSRSEKEEEEEEALLSRLSTLFRRPPIV